MSKTYVENQCPNCGNDYNGFETLILMQEATATKENLKTVSKRKMKPGEIRLLFIPGRKRTMCKKCFKRLFGIDPFG